jgi:hypothetical protein
MKVFSAIIAAAVASDASWDGVSADNTCGMVISGDNFVNKTCTVTGSSMEYIFAGNGAFINGDNTFTGYDGTSSDVNVVVFFSQSADADGNLDNSTWDASVSCADSGADYSGPFFMENVNDHRNAKNGNYNIQIANVNNGDVLSIQLMNNDGGEYGAQNITADFGTVGATADAWGNQYSDDGTFTVTVGDAVFGQLFQISVVQQPGNTGVLSMWSSTVSN